MRKNHALSFGGMSILVLDDSENMRRILSRLLRSFGFEEFHLAHDGHDALRQLEQKNIDLAIVDWHMTPVDGIDFTQTIRSRDSSPDPYLPIILLTGFTELSRVKVARDAGVNEILAKPVSPEALYGRLTSVVRRPRPYIETNVYFGPDRRRKEQADFQGPYLRRRDKQQREAGSPPP